MNRVIDDRFELVERLGGGGMGLVWRARDLALDREVALKEVRPPDPVLAETDPEGDRDRRERVLREARALARVTHPNVVTVHHIVQGDAHTYPWIVMELVTGGSLEDRLARGPLTPAEAAELGRELLSALRAAHAVGVQHRDVKPANVLLRPDGRPVLTDFGIAALHEARTLTATGSIIGSPDYMAPERITGDKGGPSADLWSLGMLLYVAVEGHHPLRRDTMLATLAAVLTEDVPPPRRAGALTGVLTALLVRDPEARPGAAELERLLREAARPGAGSAPAPQDPAPEDRAPAPEDRAPAPQPTSYRLTPPAPAPAAARTRPLPAPEPDPDPPTDPRGPRRQLRKGYAVAAVAALAGTAATGALAWTLLQAPDGGAEPRTKGRGTSTAEPTQQAPEKKQPEDLLTPDGMRTATAALEPVMDTSRVTRFVVYPEFVSAEALVEGSKNRYDKYEFRDGEARRTGPGGTIGPNTVPVDLGTIEWDALPGLLRRADQVLNVPKPKNRYLNVDTNTTPFTPKPTLNFYLSDEYGSGYLKAGFDGKVIDAYPNDAD